jgi:hypothetical protein
MSNHANLGLIVEREEALGFLDTDFFDAGNIVAGLLLVERPHLQSVLGNNCFTNGVNLPDAFLPEMDDRLLNFDTLYSHEIPNVLSVFPIGKTSEGQFGHNDFFWKEISAERPSSYRGRSGYSTDQGTQEVSTIHAA